MPPTQQSLTPSRLITCKIKNGLENKKKLIANERKA